MEYRKGGGNDAGERPDSVAAIVMVDKYKNPADLRAVPGMTYIHYSIFGKVIVADLVTCFHHLDVLVIFRDSNNIKFAIPIDTSWFGARPVPSATSSSTVVAIATR